MSGMKTIRSLSDEELKTIIEESSSKQEIMRKLGIHVKNDQVLNYLKNFIEKHNVDISHHTLGRPLRLRYTYEQTKELVDKNICWTDLMRDMGIRFVGNNIKTVKKLVEYYNISTAHFDPKRASVKNHPGVRKDSEIFCENSTVHRKTVKDKIIKDKLLEYKCAECPVTGIWNGKPIVLQLEHKNGINNDNRLSNLCFMCPNCHSQTPTFSGRNSNKDKTSVL